MCTLQMTNNSAMPLLSNENATPHHIHFDAAEYTVFIGILALSALIGVYFGYYKGNQNTINEYMLGGKTMSVFPIAMSLIVR